MDCLYVCRFSNGHIKVGRSIDPLGRIAAHVDRVGCFGVELVAHHVAPCIGSSIGRELALINRCVAAAHTRHKNEWFTGLDYDSVCQWANEAAVQDQERAAGFWVDVIQALQTAGLSQTQIADECGTNQSGISDLKNGVTKDPRYSLGSALLRLLDASTTKA